MKRIFCYVCLLFCITPAWALFCNTQQGANGWLNEGMSEQQVTAACGQPDNKTQLQNTDNRLHAMQYWNYQQQSVQVSLPTPNTPMSAVKMNTAATTLVVEVNNNRVTSIALNGNIVSSGNCPKGGLVNVGDSTDILVSRCGAATQVTSQYQKESVLQSPVTLWTYSLQNGQLLQVQFKDGVVSEINE